jgi:hypothetical protein
MSAKSNRNMFRWKVRSKKIEKLGIRMKCRAAGDLRLNVAKLRKNFLKLPQFLEKL